MEDDIMKILWVVYISHEDSIHLVFLFSLATWLSRSEFFQCTSKSLQIPQIQKETLYISSNLLLL